MMSRSAMEYVSKEVIKKDGNYEEILGTLSKGEKEVFLFAFEIQYKEHFIFRGEEYSCDIAYLMNSSFKNEIKYMINAYV
ncbi:hypothetical protein [Clostridium baratii]|uniref:hypothetical protein n=1 Tax=Clostridium baratii TaxID=1561 RepID=UPI000981BF78|nr:hypothetical protein [Clostridium baratii]AQM58531.2 hypothetical protein NPD11_3094 [Clostridium baratii]